MVKLYNGDCLEYMGKIKSNSVDMILVDPPYGKTKCKWDSVIPFEPMWNEIHRVCKDNTPVLIFGSEPFSSLLRASNIKEYRYDLYWVKEKPTNFLQLKRRAGKLTENICVFYNKQPTYNPQMVKYDGKPVTNKPSEKNAKFKSVVASNSPSQQIYEYKDNGWRYPCDILKFNREKLGSTVHPTQKPVALLEYLIKTYTNNGDVVLDFTMGSGSTGVACKNLSRNFIGIELDENYFNIAEQRIGDFDD